MTIDTTDAKAAILQHYLQAIVAPRPIALVSSVNAEGMPNLSPFSFFGLFSIQPPVVVFSPLSRLRDGSDKHTLENVREVKEVVIHMVERDIVEQSSLASHEFEKNVSEFVKAGFTQLQSDLVKPPRVAECRVAMECRVNDIYLLGNTGGAGNLVICEVLRMHIDDSLLDSEQRIDTMRLQQVARMGGDWYSGLDLFHLTKPGRIKGIGMDQLPGVVSGSGAFTRGEMAMLAGIPAVPEQKGGTEKADREAVIQKTKALLKDGKIEEAWQVLAELL